MPRKDKSIIGGLIGSLKRELKPVDVFTILDSLNKALDASYEALFDGPLPAVSGENLTNLNAEAIEGIVPLANLPSGIAFLAEENIFTESQFIEGEELSLSLAYNNGTDPIEGRLRAGIIGENEYYLSYNFFRDTGAWERDITDLGIILSLLDDSLRLSSWSLTTAEPVDGEYIETFAFAGKEITFRNLAQDDDISLIYIDDNDVARVGEDCDTTGLPNGHFAIPAKPDTELPAADATADGIIIINKTTPRICFYVNGLRYYVNGTSF